MEIVEVWWFWPIWTMVTWEANGRFSILQDVDDEVEILWPRELTLNSFAVIEGCYLLNLGGCLRYHWRWIMRMMTITRPCEFSLFFQSFWSFFLCFCSVFWFLASAHVCGFCWYPVCVLKAVRGEVPWELWLWSGGWRRKRGWRWRRRKWRKKEELLKKMGWGIYRFFYQILLWNLVRNCMNFCYDSC